MDNNNRLRENDFLLQLSEHARKPAGVFNHAHWSVDAGSHAEDNLVAMVTLHEMAHWNLSNVSLYGSAMILYARLPVVKDPRESAILDRTMSHLVIGCRFAHEVYATWFGMLAFAQHTPAEKRAVLKVHYPEYLEYFDKAQSLVGLIEDPPDAAQVLMAVILPCFQSRELYEALFIDPWTFDARMISRLSAPSNRLSLLLNELDSHTVLNMYLEFLASEEGKAYSNLPVDIFAENDTLTQKFMLITQFFYARISSYFDNGRAGSGTATLQQCMALEAVIMGHLQRKFPELELPSSTGSLKNPGLFLIHNCERETIIMNNKISPAELIFAETDLPAANFYLSVLNTAFLQTASTYRLYRQHNWTNPADKAWLNENMKYVTAFVVYNSQREIYIYIVAETADQLYTLAGQLPAGCRILALKDLSRHFWKHDKELLEALHDVCHQSFELNDLSLLTVLVNLRKGDGTFRYASYRVNFPKRSLEALVFQLPERLDEDLIINPCAVFLSRLTKAFVDQHEASVIEGLEISMPLHNDLFAILTFLFNTVFEWRYYPELLDDLREEFDSLFLTSY